MSYVLESDNKLLSLLRRSLPLDQMAIDRIKRNEVFYFREIVQAHYQINPFHPGPYSEELEDVNFEMFAKDGDPFSIVDSYRRSYFVRKDLFLDIKNLLEPVNKSIYVKWACEKAYPLPQYLTEGIIAWEPPALVSVEDAKALPYKDMPLSVLACMHSNIVAQTHRRTKPNLKISEVYNSPPVQQYLKLVTTAEGNKEMKAEDTIRGYIEHQFR